MPYSLKELRSQVLAEIGDPAGVEIHQSLVDSWLDQAQEENAARAGLVEKTWNIPTEDGKKRYLLPLEFVAINPDHVFYNNIKLLPAPEGLSSVFDGSDEGLPGSGAPRFFDIWGGYIRLDAYTRAGNTIVFRGLGVPNPLSEDADVSVVPDRFKYVLVNYAKVKALELMALRAAKTGAPADYLKQINIQIERSRSDYSGAAIELDEWARKHFDRGSWEML